MRNVKTGKFAMKFFRRPIICNGGVDLSHERSEMERFACISYFFSYLCNPSISSLMPENTLKFRKTSFSFNRMSDILGLCCNPQIGFSVIETIPVNVINYEWFWRVQYKTVHLNCLPFSTADTLFPNRIPGTTCVKGIPFILRNGGEIFFVNQCYLPLCQWNSYHGRATKKESSASPARLKPDCRVAARAEDKEVQKNSQPLFLCAWVFSFFRFILTSIPARVIGFNLITFYVVMLPQER